jgi:hypothetical protein
MALAVGGLLEEEFISMCDYSLHHVQSRAARVDDKLTTRNFGTGTRGFAAPEDPATAVCVLPGTELAFSDDIAILAPGVDLPDLRVGHKTAIFRQINKNVPLAHHDALEFPDGQMVELTRLREGQRATVLQLPAQPTTAAEAEAQERVDVIG